MIENYHAGKMSGGVTFSLTGIDANGCIPMCDGALSEHGMLKIAIIVPSRLNHRQPETPVFRRPVHPSAFKSRWNGTSFQGFAGNSWNHGKPQQFLLDENRNSHLG
jgi:hypothetical protein